MALVSASRAAKEAGVSIPTITRAIKSGKLSATNKEGGGYLIDTSELVRVFPNLKPASNDTPTKLGDETPNDNGVLQARLEAKDEQIALLVSERDDLRRRLDDEAAERRKLTLLLTDQTARPAPPVAQEPPKRRWWPFGKAND